MATKTNNLKENLKKYFYTGVGLASHSSDIFKKTVSEFVKQGRVSEDDGKKIVDSAIKKIESRMPELEKKYHEAVTKATKFANAEIAMLQKKVAGFEKKNGTVKQASTAVKSAAKKAAKKPAVKKAVKAVKKAATKAKSAAKSATKASA
ncbi:MAG TPA: hypothetical protein VK154_12250 [Chitinophagales bacterium]|nr:hypothetical protein [Chitinophagales bacterium]